MQKMDCVKHVIKISTIKFSSRFRWLLVTIVFFLIVLPQHQMALAFSFSDSSSPIPTALMKLIQNCADPKAELDIKAIAILVDYVLANKLNKETDLLKLQGCPGAYYEFDTKISFSRFLKYAYISQIPANLMRPSSTRYVLWDDPRRESQTLPISWKLVSSDDDPVIIRGFEHDSNTPDLTTGVYHEYDLARTLILFKHKGQQVLISISRQINQSDVGKKGAILGSDDDWNYYYSGEPGSFKAGMGWVKSYIYDFFSVVVYVESSASSNMLRTGTFQWIRAGWYGINFVQTSHIISGLKRFARNFKTILESPKLPTPNQMISIYQRLSTLPNRDLMEKYTALQQAQQSLAVQAGKISAAETRRQGFHAHIPKEQIIEELMLEYIKIALGKRSLVGGKIF
jgi:hypothetical protein